MMAIRRSSGSRQSGSAWTAPSWSRALFPSGIVLSAGQCYYFEALLKELAGADHLAVTWTPAGAPIPAPGSAPVSGEFLSAYGRAVEIVSSEGFLNIAWPLGGTLLSAPAASGPWTAVPITAATNRLTIPLPAAPVFFRSVE